MTGGVCFTGCTEKVTLVGELVLESVGEGDAVGVGVRGEACFRIGPELGPLAELETEAWKQVAGLWALL